LTQKNYTREEKKKKKKEGGGGYTFEVPFMLRALRRWWQPIENAKINWGGGAQCFYKTKEKVLPI